MAIATATLLALGTIAALGATAGATIYSSVQSSADAKKARNAQADMPQVPASVTTPASETIAGAEKTAEEAIIAKRRAAARSKSIFTSPLGLAGEASTAKKTLLGE